MFLQNKWIIYLGWIATEDVETQQKGLVALMFPGDNATETFFRLPDIQIVNDTIRMQKSCPYRFAAVHGCFPDAPIFHMLRAFVATASTDDFRVRMRLSYGRNTEIRYQLLAYGIPVSTIPLTDTGTVKTKHLLQWIKARQAIEEDLSLGNRSISYPKEFIDCPMSKDVVFRTGTFSLALSGNVIFRELIAQHYQQHSQAKSTEEKKEISWKIVQQVTDMGGRFLEWDRSKGCWTPMLDQSKIRVKVAITLRDFKKVVQAAQNNQVVSSSTFRFERQDGRKRPRTGEKGDDDEIFCEQFCGGLISK
jgi:hypothetical protein